MPSYGILMQAVSVCHFLVKLNVTVCQSRVSVMVLPDSGAGSPNVFVSDDATWGFGCGFTFKSSSVYVESDAQ